MYNVVAKKVHVRYLISWWVSCLLWSPMRMQRRPLYFAIGLSFSNPVLEDRCADLNQTLPNVCKWAIVEKRRKKLRVPLNVRSKTVCVQVILWRHRTLSANIFGTKQATGECQDILTTKGSLHSRNLMKTLAHKCWDLLAKVQLPSACFHIFFIHRTRELDSKVLPQNFWS